MNGKIVNEPIVWFLSQSYRKLPTQESGKMLKFKKDVIQSYTEILKINETQVL